MAQGDAFQVGINVPLPNCPRMREFDQVIYFKNDETAGAGNTIEVADADGLAIDPRDDPYVIGPANGDNDGVFVVLGPSSDSTDTNGMEEVEVTAVSSTAITCTHNFDYKAGDPITIRTKPLGWTAEDTVVDGKVYSRADGKKYGNSKINYDNGYGAKVARGYAPNILMETDEDFFIDSTATTTVDNDIAGETCNSADGVMFGFDLSSLSGMQILDASIYAPSITQGGLPGTLRAYWITAAWSLSADSPSYAYKTNGTAWDGASGNYTTAITQFGTLAIAESGDIAIPVDESIIQDMVDGTKTNNGFLFKTNDSLTVTFATPNAALELRIVATDADDDTHKIYTYSIPNTAPRDIANRLWWQYKATGESGEHEVRAIGLKPDGTSSAALFTEALALASQWTDAYEEITPNSTTHRIRIDARVKKDITETSTLTITNMALTHAKDTDDETAGVYTFDQIADAKTLDYGYIDGKTKVSLVHNASTRSGNSSNRIRWYVTCVFKRASQALYDNLMILQNHQGQGNTVAVWHNIDDIPPVLVGYIDVKEFKKADTDLDVRDLVYNFEEA